MSSDAVLDIVNICLELDEIAIKAYKELAAIVKQPDIRKFLLQMEGEEQIHAHFWKSIISFAQEGKLPEVFDDPVLIKNDLEKLMPRVKELYAHCREAGGIADVLILVYRLEFYVLHPAMKPLFQVLGYLVDRPEMEEEYGIHIDRLVNILIRYGKDTPELELLGETLDRLWKENKILVRLATHDSLTGLLTRQAFDEMSLQMAHLAQRERYSVGIMMIDIDFFKNVNDNYGHAFGDRVLKKLAGVIQSTMRSSDMVCRYGGEEFVIFLINTDAASAYQAAERVRAAVSAAKPENIKLTVSVGLVIGKIQEPEKDLQDFLKEADKILYEAKIQGRDRTLSKEIQFSDGSATDASDEFIRKEKCQE